VITIDGVIGHGAPLRRVSESFANEVIGLRGPNGSGKTTLLRTLSGLVPLVEGTVSIDGRVVDGGETFVHPENRLVRYVSGDPFPGGSLENFLAFPLRCAGIGRVQRAQAVAHVVERFGLEDLSSLSIREMSQGQLARATIARACIGSPRAILLDEPFGVLDAKNKDRMLAVLQEWLRAKGTLAIIVSHDPNDLARLCDRVMSFD
jgi:NitT/TauT family transport system ATP-binding protein